MLKEYLGKNYGYNESIFINEIRLEGLSDNALCQYFKRMMGSGVLARSSENAGLLQFLDAVSQAEKYSEFSDSETGILLKNYAKQQKYLYLFHKSERHSSKMREKYAAAIERLVATFLLFILEISLIFVRILLGRYNRKRLHAASVPHCTRC